MEDNYVGHVKKTLGVPKKIWMGMPVLITNTKLGKTTVAEPTMFYVKDFDDHSVTIVNVPKWNAGDDTDDEIDVDPHTIDGETEMTLSRKDFYNLLEPPPGTDPGLGGMGI